MNMDTKKNAVARTKGGLRIAHTIQNTTMSLKTPIVVSAWKIYANTSLSHLPTVNTIFIENVSNNYKDYQIRAHCVVLILLRLLWVIHRLFGLRLFCPLCRADLDSPPQCKVVSIQTQNSSRSDPPQHSSTPVLYHKKQFLKQFFFNYRQNSRMTITSSAN